MPAAMAVGDNLRPLLGCEPIAMTVELVHPDAIPPKRTTEGAAGMDLYSPVQVEVPCDGKGVHVPTGLKFDLPDDVYGQVKARSGLTFKHNIHVGAGTIDRDFKGEVVVHLRCHGDKPYTIQKGERFAQFIIQNYATPTIHVGKVTSDTVRGEKGFGSTGTVDSLPAEEPIE